MAPGHSHKLSVMPADDNKRILPVTPWPGDELVHHMVTGAMNALERGEIHSAEQLLQVALSQQTHNRWIYHCIASFHLALLNAENEVPKISLLCDSLKANPTFPAALELLMTHDRNAAENIIREATRLEGLDTDVFLGVVQSGIWKNYSPFRNCDDMFRGKNLLDVGARHGFHGLIFLAWGGHRYAATDVAKDSFTIRQLKNQRTLNHDRTPLKFSMRELADRYPQRLHLAVGERETLQDTLFDFITLFSVTEHLKPPAELFATLCKKLSPGGKIFATHHNFYCWNGHHARPKSVPQLNEMTARGEEPLLADWSFFEKPLAASLNRLTIGQLRDEVERHFKINSWQPAFTQHNKGLERLTPEIARRVAPLSLTDILTQSIHMVLECPH